MENLINITLNELNRDGITSNILEGLTEKDRINLILAYAASAKKHFEHFQSHYLTNPIAKEGFQKLVLSSP